MSSAVHSLSKEDIIQRHSGVSLSSLVGGLDSAPLLLSVTLRVRNRSDDRDTLGSPGEKCDKVCKVSRIVPHALLASHTERLPQRRRHLARRGQAHVGLFNASAVGRVYQCGSYSMYCGRLDHNSVSRRKIGICRRSLTRNNAANAAKRAQSTCSRATMNRR